jgi:hypothetical protein
MAAVHIPEYECSQQDSEYFQYDESGLSGDIDKERVGFPADSFMNQNIGHNPICHI